MVVKPVIIRFDSLTDMLEAIDNNIDNIVCLSTFKDSEGFNRISVTVYDKVFMVIMSYVTYQISDDGIEDEFDNVVNTLKAYGINYKLCRVII